LKDLQVQLWLAENEGFYHMKTQRLANKNHSL